MILPCFVLIVKVPLARTALLFIAVLLTASAVAIVGGITFLGLIAPHSARRIVVLDRPAAV